MAKKKVEVTAEAVAPEAVAQPVAAQALPTDLLARLSALSQEAVSVGLGTDSYQPNTINFVRLKTEAEERVFAIFCYDSRELPDGDTELIYCYGNAGLDLVDNELTDEERAWTGDEVDETKIESIIDKLRTEYAARKQFGTHWFKLSEEITSLDVNMPLKDQQIVLAVPGEV